jgi:hypothetical protein
MEIVEEESSISRAKMGKRRISNYVLQKKERCRRVS